MLSPAAALLAIAAAPQVGVDIPPTLDYYLPGRAYDASFPKPSSVLGWEVGEWHVRHDQLVDWFETVAAASPRVKLETYAQTHERRPLLLATITSPANHERLEELRRAHVEAVLGGAQDHDGPAVVWLGYGVHGNESSASNAALVVLYHLAAATGEDIDAFLEDTIVLLDPCINPDGGARFAHWANMHKGRHLVADGAHREHNEAWPGGRTNHYWFDLNRDWLLLTHPESQGRVAQFHRWLPCILTDYHEMGTGSTYFFQPGIPTRTNPLTPRRNVALTGKIALFHAAALDRLGSLYLTEERFDDFYYGKGSTYPDIHGAIGILFEQASSRGHLQENSYGPLSFPFTIRNQVTTSLSTLEASLRLRDELTSYQREFFHDALVEAAGDGSRGWIFGAPEDPTRSQRMARILRGHGIRLHALASDVTLADGTRLEASSPATFVVPNDQPQYRLVRALFETRTSWPDNTFYDVSSWTLPLSFGVPYGPCKSTDLIGEALDAPREQAAGRGEAPEGTPTVAWLVEWHDSDVGALLGHLLRHDVKVRVSTKPLTAVVAAPGGAAPASRAFDRGTLVVQTGTQSLSADELREVFDTAPGRHEIFAMTSGITPEGADLGSSTIAEVARPEIALVVGGRTSSYEAGEVWHHLDTRVGLPVSLVEAESAGRLDLAEYTHLVLVNGATSGWGEGDRDVLRDWVRRGGVLVATKGSATWAARELLATGEEPKSKEKDDEPEPDPEALPPIYDQYADRSAQERVAGTIFRARMDLTHPLTFGYVRGELPVFRNSSSTLPESRDPFAVPVRYTDEPLVSGFASDANVAKIAGTPAVRAERLGSGAVVCLVDDPLFRGVWDGTARLFENALFFARAIDRTGPLDDEE